MNSVPDNSSKSSAAFTGGTSVAVAGGAWALRAPMLLAVLVGALATAALRTL